MYCYKQTRCLLPSFLSIRYQTNHPAPPSAAPARATRAAAAPLPPNPSPPQHSPAAVGEACRDPCGPPGRRRQGFFGLAQWLRGGGTKRGDPSAMVAAAARDHGSGDPLAGSTASGRGAATDVHDCGGQRPAGGAAASRPRRRRSLRERVAAGPSPGPWWAVRRRGGATSFLSWRHGGTAATALGACGVASW